MGKSSRYTLAIDLDETCIHATVMNHHKQQVKDGIVKPENAYIYYKYVIRLRNGVKEFLQKAKKKFNLVIFTAAHRSYAEFVRNILDPEKKIFDKIYSRENCTVQYGLYRKDLKIVDKDVKKVILIDNSQHVFMTGQYGLHVRDFRGRIDNEMLNLWYCLDKLHVHTDMHQVINDVSKNHNLHIREKFVFKNTLPQKRNIQETKVKDDLKKVIKQEVQASDDLRKIVKREDQSFDDSKKIVKKTSDNPNQAVEELQDKEPVKKNSKYQIKLSRSVSTAILFSILCISLIMK